jgi:pathogenesis-related protein 1
LELYFLTLPFVPHQRRVFVIWCCFSVAVATLEGQRQIHFTGPGPEGALARDMLAAHNQVRERAEVPPLIWSDRLATVAQDWASHLLQQGQFYHRPHPVYGENLLEINYSNPVSRALPAQVVAIWAGEAKNYSYSSNTCRGMCGHYTQIVWSSTREVGCAVAHDATREVWVCNYNPPGNWVGERPY